MHRPPRALAWWALLALAAPATPAFAAPADDPGDFKALRDRGVHYYRVKQMPAALKVLKQAAATPEGAEDFKTRFTLAKVAYKLLHIELALPEAEAAKALAKRDSHRAASANLLKELKSFFAGVTLTQAPQQRGKVKKGFIHLKETGGLINKRKKEVFRKIEQRFRTTQVSLPTTIYLPFGKYTANLAPFEITQGETATAVTFLDTRAEEGVSLWWYAGGAAVLAGATAAVVLMAAPEETPQRIDLVSVDLGDPP